MRQDGVLIGGIDLAIAELAKLSQPSELLFGIDHGNAGKVIIFRSTVYVAGVSRSAL